MKSVSRLLLVGVTTAAASVLALASPAAAVAPAPEASAAAAACTATTAGNTVSGNCVIDTFLGSFGATFTGTIQSNGYGSGTITMKAGFLGTRTGSWTGGPFLSGSTATINYTIPSPVGAFTGSFQVAIP